ncbi:MAG: c-type cytochrome [Magnetococcales bacterium]|nr:c-type cytochrome [Magnetococcales bacterium]
MVLFAAILLFGFWEMVGVDVSAGKRLADNHCGVCHDLTNNKLHEKGPYLWGVVNRQAGSVGFNYSDAFRNRVSSTPFVWDEAHLDEFLKAPNEFLTGTRMTQTTNKHALAFSGITDRANRKNLIAYLKTLH